MQSFIIRNLPYIIAGLALTVIMVGAYVSVGPIQSAAPKAGWGTDPVTITFAATAGQGSAIDSFTCAPSTTSLTLIAHASTGNIALTVAPSSFSFSSWLGATDQQPFFLGTRHLIRRIRCISRIESVPWS